MTDLEKEFVVSLKALFVRYGVNLRPAGDKTTTSVDIGDEKVWLLTNNAKFRETEVFLYVGEIFNELHEG